MSLADWLTVAGPMVAGVFALLGGWFGTKLGKATEHEQWLRDRKKEAYVKFLHEARKLLNEAMWLERGVERAEWTKARAEAIRPTDIALLAPDDIRETTLVVHGHLLWLAINLTRETERQPHVVRSRTAAEEGLERLHVRCREDLRDARG